jgi:hypothetical protein
LTIAFDGATPRPTVTDQGDGTVPSLSATALALGPERQFAVGGLDHATACLHPRVRELTSELL